MLRKFMFIPILMSAVLVIFAAYFIKKDIASGITGCSRPSDAQGSADSTQAAVSDSDVETGAGGSFVALTFDDGPNPLTTPALLDGLKSRNVQATFFVIGEKAAENPDIIRRMYEDGHIIGNHTYTHCNLSENSINSSFEEIECTNLLIAELTGVTPTYIRPPYGECSDSLANSLSMFKILWDVDPRDWSIQNAAYVSDYIISSTKSGDIILLHDIFESSVEAALAVIDSLTVKGYEFVTIEELLFP